MEQQLREKHKHIAIFPCRLRILPDCIFNARDPIILGVRVEEGQIKQGTRLCVATKGMIDIGVVSSLEFEHHEVEVGKRGMDVCIKIEAAGGDKKLFGRHFTEQDDLVSKVQSVSFL